MHVADPVHLRSGWHAELALEFERRGRQDRARGAPPRAVRSSCRSRSIPEGDARLPRHRRAPAGGIAGGDELDVAVRAAAGAHALLTTPGAGRWYRSAGPWARQTLAFEARERRLPRVAAAGDDRVRRRARATCARRCGSPATRACIGWEVLCLGRTGSGERFTRGECRLRDRASGATDGRCGRSAGASRPAAPCSAQPAGLGGQQRVRNAVCGGAGIGAAEVARCREVSAGDGRVRGDAAARRAPRALSRGLERGGEARISSSCGGGCGRRWRAREALEPRIWRT